VNEYELRRRLGLSPDVPFEWIALRQAYRLVNQRWALRWETEADGVARCYPLFVKDLEAWVRQVWDDPDLIRGTIDAP